MNEDDMNENDAIEICEAIAYERGSIRENVDGKNEDIQAIKTIIELYKQEKEKNEELEDVVKLMSIALTPFETPTNGVIWTSSEVRNTFFETIKKNDSERLKELLEEE